MRRVVIVDLAGGIGNQIFLFQMANFVGAIDNRVILVNKTSIDKKHSNGNSTIEDFIFPFQVKFFNLNKVQKKFYIKFGLMLKKLNKFRQSFVFVLDDSYHLEGSSKIKDIILQRKPKIILITGFWQNFSFWNDNFKYRLKIESPKYKKFLNDLQRKNPIVFHYRLGRVEGGWENPWGALSPKFLLESLSVLKIDDKNSRPIWIFSNDLMSAKDLFNAFRFAPYNIFFIDDNDFRPSEVVSLLSKSRTLVCSNSTFSIVAAKMGNVENVIVPSDLSKNFQHDMKFPVSWHKVTPEWLDAKI